MNNTENNAVTVSEMKEIERRADEAGLSYYQMMENAGTESYKVIKDEYPGVDNLLIFCGKGNNGGDGLVVARLAVAEGQSVCVILVEGTPVTRDAVINFEKLPETVNILGINDLYEKEGCPVYDKIIKNDTNKTVIVDALYGTGFHGELREIGRKACNIINSLGCPVIALDVPSGCNADSREVSDGAVKADITVPFHSYKNVHVPAVINCGKCRLVSIGVEKVFTQ